MKKNGELLDGDMVNNDLEHVEAEEGSSVGGRGKTVRRGSVPCKLSLSRITAFVTPRLPCLFCDRSFLNAVLLQKHTNRCHRVTPARRTSARNVEQTNVTTNNYHPGCNFCNCKQLAVQKANDLPGLFHHLLEEHSLKYFGCRLCQLRFSTSKQLKTHNETIHPIQLPASETNKVKCTSNSSVRDSFEPFETDLSNLNAKVLTKRVSLSTPSKSSTPSLLSDNKKELRSRKNLTNNTTSIKTLSKDNSAIAADTRQPVINKDIENKSVSNVDIKTLQDVIVLIPPPPKDGLKPIRKSTSDKDVACESIDKKLSRMSRASVTLTPVQIKPVSNSDPQILSRLGLVQNRSPRTQSLRRNRKIPSVETRSSSEVARRDKSKGKNDNEFVINKNKNDPTTRFDPDFYSTVSNNVRENLVKYLDGKLEKCNVVCDVPDVIDPKIGSTHAVLEEQLQKQPAEIHGSDVALNAITIFPTLLAQDQYGSDKVPHYSYGANSQGFKKAIIRNSWKWKWDITKKIKQIPDVGKRDLSRLDIWTQLAMRERYDKSITKSSSEDSEFDSERSRRQKQVNELNAILERRVFPDIQNELKSTEQNCEETVEEVANVKIEKTENIKPIEVTSEKLSFMTVLGLELINQTCSSKETTVFSGEWQRPRCYVCSVCGRRADCVRLMEAHQGSQHPQAQATYYELVGKEALDTQLYKHLYIPGARRNIPSLAKKVVNKKSCKFVKFNQSTRILRTTARNIKSQERACTKCSKVLLPSELYRHILECAGDYGWMMSKRKCKSKPFGVRRRRLKGLYKRERPQEDGEKPEKDTSVVLPRPKLPPRPRSKPSDVETIQRMLANLPAKRATKQVLDLSTPKARKPVNKRHSRILKRILPDPLIQRSKTTVVRTIKDKASGKLRRVTRSITNTRHIINRNFKDIEDDGEKKTKVNIKSKKEEEIKKTPTKKDLSKPLDLITEDSPKSQSLNEEKKKRRSVLKISNVTRSSVDKQSSSKDKDTDVLHPKNDAASVTTENSKDSNENTDTERRFLRRRPEVIRNPKILRKRRAKFNHISDKSVDSNSENKQDNSNPISIENKNDNILPSKLNSTATQTKSSLSTAKRKSKKVLGLPLKWIGKRGKFKTKLKRRKNNDKVVANNEPIDSSNTTQNSELKFNDSVVISTVTTNPEMLVFSSSKECENNAMRSVKSSPTLKSADLNERNKQMKQLVNQSSNVPNSNIESNLSFVTLSNDLRHSNIDFNSFGNQSHDDSTLNQNQYQHIFNSNAQDGNVSNIESRTSPMSYNHPLGYYLPSSLQIISHSKHDNTFERSGNSNKADDFPLDNIDKPPLFSSVRAQSQMKDLIDPDGYFPPSMMMVQKAYTHADTLYMAHCNMTKSKLPNKSKRGLNDCIAMLRGKLTANKSDDIDVQRCMVPTSSMPLVEESSLYDDNIQPLDLSGKCQAEDLSINRNNDGPENLTVPKPRHVAEELLEVQDLSMKSATRTTPSKSPLINVRKPVFDPTLRIPQYSAPIEHLAPKPSTSTVDQGGYIVHANTSSTPTMNPLFASKALVPQPALDLASNISHELSLLPQALVNTIEKLPPFQQEEIVKVLPQVLVKAVENYNLLRTETSKRQNETGTSKNIPLLSSATEMSHSLSPATREEHIRPRPTVIPQTSEISTQTSVLPKDEEIQKCPPEYVHVNTDMYLIDPMSGKISERNVDKKLPEPSSVSPPQPHEVIDLTDENIVKEPEEVIPAAIIEKPKDPESNVRSLVVIDPSILDKTKVLERSKPAKGTASLRAVRIKSTSEKLKIKNMAMTGKSETLQSSVIVKPIQFLPQEVPEPAIKTLEDKVGGNNREETVNTQISIDNKITSSKDKNVENAEPIDVNTAEVTEPAIQQDEVSSTQHSSVEDNSDISVDAPVKHSMSPLQQKLTDIQMKTKEAFDLPESAKKDDTTNKSLMSVPEVSKLLASTPVENSVLKPVKQRQTSRRKRASKLNKEKIVQQASEPIKHKENTLEKEIKEINPVVDKRDKCEPKNGDSESDKKSSFGNLLKECNTLSESALTPSNVIDYHTERKALDKCENIQVSEPAQDDIDSEANITVRRSLRSKKTILKETRASIEKDRGLFGNQENSNDVEPIPFVPGAIIPEEPCKANLGNTTEIVGTVTKLHKTNCQDKDESDDDDNICLAAFSKKKSSEATSTPDSLLVEQISNDSEEKQTHPESEEFGDKKKVFKAKKRASRQKKSLIKDTDDSAIPEPKSQEYISVKTVSIVPVIENVMEVATAVDPKNDEKKLLEETVSESAEIVPILIENKKETTRKSGRIKTQKESFASIDSVKLSENGHLIFKMHKKQKDTSDTVVNIDKTDVVTATSESVTISTEPPVSQEITAEVTTKSRKPKKKTNKNKTNKIEDPPLIVPIESSGVQETKEELSSNKIIPPCEIEPPCDPYVLFESVATTQEKFEIKKKRKERKQARENEKLTLSVTESEKVEEEVNKQVVLKNDHKSETDDITESSKLLFKKSKVSKLLPVVPLVEKCDSLITVIQNSKNMNVTLAEKLVPVENEKADVSNSSDEDIVLCKLVPKKKLKKLRNRTSLRSTDLIKHIPEPPPTLDISGCVIPIETEAEVRKCSSRIKNLSKKITLQGESEVSATQTESEEPNLSKVGEIESQSLIDESLKSKKTKITKEKKTAETVIVLEKNVPENKPDECGSKKKKSKAKVQQKSEILVSTIESLEKDMKVTNEPVNPETFLPLTPPCETAGQITSAEEVIPTKRKSKKSFITEKKSTIESPEKTENLFIKKIRTKAARKDDPQQILQEPLAVERVLSPRRSAKKNVTDNIPDKTQEVSLGESICTDNPLVQIVTPTKGGRKTITRKVISENMEEYSTKLLKTDEIQVLNVTLFESLPLPRKSKKSAIVNESSLKENEQSKAELKTKASVKDNFATPDVSSNAVVSPRRSAKKSYVENDQHVEAMEKDGGSKTKENIVSDLESIPIPEQAVSLRRTSKRSPVVEVEQLAQIKEKQEVHLKTKATLKEHFTEASTKNVQSQPNVSRKSYLEKELQVQQAEKMKDHHVIAPKEVTLISSKTPERVLSPRKSKKSLSTKEVEHIKSDVDTSEALTNLPVEEKVVSPRKSRRSLQVSEVVSVAIEEEPLSKSIRKTKATSKNDAEEAQKTSKILDESDTKIVRRKSSRTALKESPVIEKQVRSDDTSAILHEVNVALGYIEDNTTNIADIILNKVEPENLKSAVRFTARSSLRSKRETSLDHTEMSPSESDTPAKNKKQTESAVDSSIVIPTSMASSDEQSHKSESKVRRRCLSPIIIDTTPNRVRSPKPQKKIKKNISQVLGKAPKESHKTFQCVVSLDDLKMEKDSHDISILNHNVISASTLNDICIHKSDFKIGKTGKKNSNKKKDNIITVRKPIENISPSTLCDPDIIEPSNEINCNIPILQEERINKRKPHLEIPMKTSRKQIVRVDVHVSKEDSNIEPPCEMAPTIETVLSAEPKLDVVSKKSIKHKKSSSKPKVPKYDAIDDDISSEEPLQFIVDAGKHLNDLDAKLFEEEVSDKTDSSTCLANLITQPQKKSKKKKNKGIEKRLNDTSTKKLNTSSKSLLESKLGSIMEDSLSDSDSLIKLQSNMSKTGVKRKRKTNEVSQKSKQPTSKVTSQDTEELSKLEAPPEILLIEKDTSAISVLPTDPESIQDKYLADFGMYTEKRPRKSTLLAMKKISKTFKPDGEDNSDENKSEDESKTKKIVQKKTKKPTPEPKSTETVKHIIEPHTLSTSLPSPREEKNDLQSSASLEMPDTDCKGKIESTNISVDVKHERPLVAENIITGKTKKPKQFSEHFCALCKRRFRRQENLLKHQMTLMHISRVSEVEATESENKVSNDRKIKMSAISSQRVAQEEESSKPAPQPAPRVHKNLAERKSFDNKSEIKIPETPTVPLEQTGNKRLLNAKDSPQRIIEITTDTSRKTLSRDEALFFECCSLLKESSDLPLAPTVGQPASPLPNYPLPSEQNNSSSDSTPYISGVKNILKASELVPPSLTGESDNTMELSQTDSNSELPHMTPDGRAFAFANKRDCVPRSEDDGFKHFLSNKHVFGQTTTAPTHCTSPLESKSPDTLKTCSGDYDPYYAESLMVRTNSDDFSDNNDSLISSQDVDNLRAITNKAPPILSSELSSLCHPSLLINEFEDKFDKIKRKAREKAQAAQEAMAAVMAPSRTHSKKSSKKGSTSKSRKMAGDKKAPQQSSSKCQKSKKKSKKKSVNPPPEKGNSKKILTKAALKGFDSVKIAINSEEVNFQDVLDYKRSPDEYTAKKDMDLEHREFDVNDEKSCNNNKSLPSFGRSAVKEKQTLLLNCDPKADSPTPNESKLDIYEFMDDEEDNMSDSFKFRTPTAINRAKKGELPSASCNKSSIDVQNDDSQISSLSFSDRDDFTYMSDDYNAHESEDETNHSSNSIEHSCILSKSLKKHKKSSKHRNIKKNAIMGKIFKNNAIRNNESPENGGENNEGATGGNQTDMDQLFDSLLEQAAPENKLEDTENKAWGDATDTDDMYSAGDEGRLDEKAESDSDNEDTPTPIPAYPRTNQRKIVPRLKARSSDDESMQPLPPPPQLGKNIDIGVASHKSQRKCTTGKQNVLVESWSSESDYEDFRQFEEYSSIPRSQKHRRPRRSGRHRQMEQQKLDHLESIDYKSIDNTYSVEEENQTTNYDPNELVDLLNTSPDLKQDPDDPNMSSRRVGFTSSVGLKSKNSKRKRRQAPKPFDYDDEFKPTRIAEPSTTQRRNKRAASEMLYYWSSSSDDDVKNAPTDMSGRETEPVEQHGWIVGDSHKKLVTMLAHAKGRKVDDNASVKEKKSRPSS